MDHRLGGKLLAKIVRLRKRKNVCMKHCKFPGLKKLTEAKGT